MNKIIRYIGFENNKIKDFLLDFKKQNKDNIILTNNYKFSNNINSSIALDIRKKINSFDINKKDISIILNKYFDNINIDKFIEILDLFLKSEKISNIEIFINFISKMIFWLKKYIQEKDTKKNISLLSYVYIGDIKKHIIYFLLLLSNLGINIIYINTEGIDKFTEIKNIEKYSDIIYNNNHFKINNDIFNILISNTTIDAKINNLSNEISKNDDIYIGYAGCNIEKELYISSLIDIENSCINKNLNILKINQKFPPLNNDEINYLNNKFSQKNNNEINYLQDNIPNKVLEIINSLKQNENQTINIKNFIFKMIGFIKRYKKYLNNKSVLIYFGDIKTQEIYFLKILRLYKVNIIYINPSISYNKQIESILDINLIKGDTSYNITEYPKNNTINCVSTLANKVSGELNNVIYNSDTKMYKPFQLNSKKMSTIVLNTTIDEISILWNEPTKFRTGFIDNNNIVKLPIIFAKINGIKDKENDYWEFVSNLTNINSKYNIIKNIPFYNNPYTKQEYYKGEFLFKEQTKEINKEKIKKSSYYKFGYFNNELQATILNKIEELINLSNIFKFKDNKHIYLKILMTILSLPDKFTNLLENYSFGEIAPKLIIYNNNKTQYTDEETIIIIFMFLIGIDIILLNPTGFNNIENNINPIFNTYNFNNMIDNLQFRDNQKTTSIFKKIFKNIKRSI